MSNTELPVLAISLEPTLTLGPPDTVLSHATSQMSLEHLRLPKQTMGAKLWYKGILISILHYFHHRDA